MLGEITGLPGVSLQPMLGPKARRVLVIKVTMKVMKVTEIPP